MALGKAAMAAVALLLACRLDVAGAAAPPDTACFDCPWLMLPLDEWTAERNRTTREVLPWGQEVEFQPIDYRQLAEELCQCVLDSLEGQNGTRHPPSHYVQAEGTQFSLHGEPFRFTGFNAAQALPWAASGDTQLLEDLQSLFVNAADLGLRVGRVFVSANGPKVRPPFVDRFDALQPELREAPWLTLQVAPGVMNETVLAALDHLLSLAASHGIRLVLTMAVKLFGITNASTDYHAVFGSGPAGIEPFVQWVKGSLNLTGSTVLGFYTDERIKLLYKHSLCAVANRVNSLTGTKYKDDPTLFSWDLINEPRCPVCPGPSRGAVLSAWADEMSTFLSCVDGNHMVHVGTEGYFTEATPEYLPTNPGTWSLCTGMDFAMLAALPHIHYGVAHMYEHMRGTWDEATRSDCGWECVTQWFHTWLQAHIDASSAVTGKPFVLEEYSKAWDEERRNEMFRLVQDAFHSAWQQNASSPAAGSMFWGATAGSHIDWDGWQIRLDGGRSVPAPTEQAEELKKQMPPEEKQWLADVDAMQVAFRHSMLADLCQAHIKEDFASTFAGYSSDTTLGIVVDMAGDAAAASGAPAVIVAASPDGRGGR